MRCKDCANLVQARHTSLCRLSNNIVTAYDGCSNGQVKVEEYEDKQVFTFDDMERLVRK